MWLLGDEISLKIYGIIKDIFEAPIVLKPVIYLAFLI
jgi:hypothetical protein